MLGVCSQRLNAPNSVSYINSGKAYDVMSLVNATGATVVVVDDDLNSKMQRNLVRCLNCPCHNAVVTYLPFSVWITRKACVRSMGAEILKF